jgi:hypothetical protein
VRLGFQSWHKRAAGAAAAVLIGGVATTAGASAGGFAAPVQLQGSCGGEPSVDRDASDNVFVSAPKGILSGLASCQGVGNTSGGAATWYSLNHATTFSNEIDAGTANGGGDTDTTVDPSNGDIYLADLEAVASDICVSHDHGATWKGYPPTVGGEVPCTTVAAPPPSQSNQGGPEADREWLNVYGPTGAYPHHDVYLTYHDFATGAPLQFVSRDGGAWTPQAPGPAVTGDPAYQSAIANGTVLAKPVVDAAGDIYALVTTQATGNGPLTSMWLIKSTDHGATWTDTNIFSGPSTSQMGLVFNDLAIDGGGNLYALSLGNSSAAVSATNPVHAYLFVSTNQGANWTQHDITPADGNALALAALHGGQQAGQLAIGWYHAKDQKDPGAITGNDWEYQALLSSNATSSSPTFATTVLGIDTAATAATNPNNDVHQGQICVQGINCTTGQVVGGGQGNRNLADFSSVTIDSGNCAIYVYADDGAITADQNNFAFSLVNNDVTRQTSGCFSTLGTQLPEAGWTPLLVVVAALPFAMWVRRRRNASTAA